MRKYRSEVSYQRSKEQLLKDTQTERTRLVSSLMNVIEAELAQPCIVERPNPRLCLTWRSRVVAELIRLMTVLTPDGVLPGSAYGSRRIVRWQSPIGQRIQRAGKSGGIKR